MTTKEISELANGLGAILEEYRDDLLHKEHVNAPTAKLAATTQIKSLLLEALPPKTGNITELGDHYDEGWDACLKATRENIEEQL